MTQQLPPATQRLLFVVARVVPSQDRTEWLRGWEAELWHVHFGSSRKPGRWFYADLWLGSRWMRSGYGAKAGARHGPEPRDFACYVLRRSASLPWESAQSLRTEPQPGGTSARC